MYICNYCGRHLKKKHDKCPGCGAKDFKKINNYGEEIIKTPPKGGYKVNLENYKLEKKSSKTGIMLLFVILGATIPVIIFILLFFVDFNKKLDYEEIFMLVFSSIFIILTLKACSPIFNKIKEIRGGANKNINKIKELSKNGILIKNLSYKVKPVKISNNALNTTYLIQVIYEIEKGKTMCFESEPKYLSALGRDDGTVDLLIDPNDYSNYFIDFEIY